MIAKRVNENIFPGEITVDNIREKTYPSEESVNDLEQTDIPEIRKIIDYFEKRDMRFFDEESAMA